MGKKGITYSIQAYGNSMHPLLQHGDTVEYIQTPFRSIKLNDIVLIYVNGVLMTHRVIYKMKNTCITRGDNNATADTAIQKGRIFGKVVRFKRKGAWHDIQDVYLTQSTLYLHEIQKLTTILRKNKIPHVFIKGVLISLRYENAIPKRIYADCDILIQHNMYTQIEKQFLLLGYKPISLAKTDSVAYFKPLSQQPEVNFIKTVHGIPIVFDVHFEPVFLMSRLKALDLLYPRRLLESLGKVLISRSTSKQIKGFRYSLCSVPDQIIYLALHIFHHNYTDSIRYQLLDIVIHKSATRNVWDDIQKTIIEYHLEGYLYLVFIILKKYFKTPIPPPFLSVIRPSHFALYITRLMTRRIDIFSQDSRMKAGMERFILIFLLSPEPFWKKILLLVHPEVIYTIVQFIISVFLKEDKTCKN